MKNKCLYAAITCLIGFLFISALFSVALDDEVYFVSQVRSGVTDENSGMTTEERQALNQNICKYLAGREALDDTLTDDEKTHMADVKRIFTGARIAMITLIVCAAVLLFVSGYRRPRYLLRAYGKTLIVFAGVCLILTGIVSLDFSYAFDCFHRLAFTNDLWMMNPETSVIIRLMPEGFFTRLLGWIAIRFTIRAGIAAVLLWAARWLPGMETRYDVSGNRPQ